MVSREISFNRSPTQRAFASSGLDRLALIPIVVGLLTAVSVLSLVYLENRAVQNSFEAAEVWSAYQLKTIQSKIEEDPNLKAQYAEEQDVLHGRAQDLKEKSSAAGHAVTLSAYAGLTLLLAAATAVFARFAHMIHVGYAAILLGVIGVGLGVRALF